MKTSAKTRGDLDKKFQKVIKTPAGFDFFIAIHDFIEHIEDNITLSNNLSMRIKSNRDLKITTKFGLLKQIYQGLEDIDNQTSDDLGHSRYMICGDLSKIRNNNLSEGNSLWKKREIFRKIAGEIYEQLNLNPV